MIEEILIEIFILFLLVILIISVLFKVRSESNKSHDEDLEKKLQMSLSQSREKQSQVTFDAIVDVLREGFQPTAITNEDGCETQLLDFLSLRFPNIIIRRGHTAQGKKIDLVIEGTYAIELALVVNEGRLIFLMDQIMRSQQDFGKIAVILVDINEVSNEKLQQYITEIEKYGVVVIIKKAS